MDTDLDYSFRVYPGDIVEQFKTYDVEEWDDLRPIIGELGMTRLEETLTPTARQFDAYDLKSQMGADGAATEMEIGTSTVYSHLSRLNDKIDAIQLIITHVSAQSELDGQSSAERFESSMPDGLRKALRKERS